MIHLVYMKHELQNLLRRRATGNTSNIMYLGQEKDHLQYLMLRIQCLSY